MRTRVPVFAGLLALAAKSGHTDPTWPAPTDEMEEIVFQLQGFKGRLFNDQITPCNNEAAGPGRVTASEWLRIGFHDMSTANRFFGGSGGLDASVQFELTNGENTGPGHNTTLKWFSNFLSRRSSMADLIAAGVYASVRGCGGPVVPLRLGRIDAAQAGAAGVPQPQNSVGTFRQQFDRMGFTATEMIQVTACGHTLGGVHTEEFPDLVPAGTGVNGQVPLDDTVAVFDNKVVTEYLAGTTKNPLVVGPSIALGRHSDFKVFNSDGNATVNTMTTESAFRSICASVLQKMIDVVPPGVALTDPIVPYTIKPVDMQLRLNTGGTTLFLNGYIRLRTTNIPSSSVSGLTFTWKDRAGGNSCGSGGCSRTFTHQGASQGFDDTFVFYPIEATIPASAGISSFTVKLNFNNGTSTTYDNNGNSYPLSDAVILQKPQSCLAQSTGTLTVTALVRNDITDTPNLSVSYLTPRGTANGNPVPALNEATVAMTKGDCVGRYTFYSASYTITGGLSYNAKVGVSAGSEADDFKHAGDLTGSCVPYVGGATCTDDTDPPPVSSSSVSSSSTAPTSSTASSTTASSSSATGTPTPAIKEIVGGYRFVDCWTEGTGVRALTGAAFAYDGMTLETCMGNCTGFDYWGTEYGRECYCGNSLASSSQEAPVAECNMLCSGDPLEFCGAGNRLELYSTTANHPSSTTTTTPTSASSSTPSATATLGVKPVVGAYTFVGCQTEATGTRALSANSYAADTMTLESCATFCAGYAYFGTEYGRECYCGNGLSTGSAPAPLPECNMVCAGDPLEYCGAGNRLELYRLTNLPSSMTTSAPSPTTSTAAPTATLSHKSALPPDYTLAGCFTEGTGVRALTGDFYASGTAMTLESCADFCADFKYFGTEYASECFCGNVLHATSTEVALSECNMPCSGNPFQYCGAGNRLELYVKEE